MCDLATEPYITIFCIAHLHNKLLSTNSEQALVFIRYNPHTYYKCGCEQRVSGTDKAQASQAQSMREEVLRTTICNMQFGHSNTLSVLYMYYDCTVQLNPWVLAGNVDASLRQRYQLSIWDDPTYCCRIRSRCIMITARGDR